MNRVNLIGRLTKDPELRYTPGKGTAVCTVTIAVDDYDSKNKKKIAYFIPVVIWGKQAENLAQYMSKGSMISVTGKLVVRSYEAKDGSKRYVTEVSADLFNGISFLSKSANGNGNSDNSSNYNGNNNYNNGVNNYNNNYSSNNIQNDFSYGFGDGFGSPVDDSDMPF